MQVVDTRLHLAQSLAGLIKNSKNRTVGFVPTMGALHHGHLQLIKRARAENDIVVCSIFVNPTQFNDKQDLENYPRSLEQDLKLLENDRCDVVFTPIVTEMYPEGEHLLSSDLSGLDEVMEGKYRPGHFKGMITIVDALLQAVNPTTAYFGEKDFQQLAIIKYYVKQQNLPYQIIGCETIREEDGLAYSSRNVLLNHEERNTAPVIYKTLSACLEQKKIKSVEALKAWAIEQINNSLVLKVQYLSIVNADSLKDLKSWDEPGPKRACIAVFAGKTRLIDNIAL